MADMVCKVVVRLCLGASILALFACDEGSREGGTMDAAAEPACATGSTSCVPPAPPGEPLDGSVPSIDGGEPLVSFDAGLLPDVSSARPPPSAAELGPCVAGASTSPAYELCIWTAPSELARIHADPEARLEIAARVSLDGRVYEGAELELHGGSGRRWPKKSYRVRFPDERPTFDFFGTGAEKTERVVLQAAWIDPTFIRNKLIFDTLNDIGAWAPRLGYARVYINGQLSGLYQVIERIDEHFLKRHGLDRDGNLYKAESEGADFRTHDRTLLGFDEVTNEDGRADDLDDLLRAVMDTEISYAAYQRELATRIALDDFVLWNIVMSHALNLDTFIKNYYLYHDPAATEPARGSVFRIIHWDADASYGIDWDKPRADQLERASLWSQPYDELPDNELARRMFSIPEYRSAYLARFEELLRGPLSPALLGPKADALLSALEPFIRTDLAQWQRASSFDEERAFLKQMIELRARVMTQAIATMRAN